MALIKCKECGKEISETAPTCPNCGYLQKPIVIHNPLVDEEILRKRKWTKRAIIFILIIGLLSILPFILIALGLLAVISR